MIFDTLSSEELTILRIVFEKKTISKEEIMAQSGFKSTTLNRLLEQLREQQLVVVCGEGESTGGRRPLLYSLNDAFGCYFIGINFGMHHIELALLHYSGRLVNLQSVLYSPDIVPETLLNEVGRMLDAACTEAGVEKREIFGGYVSVFCAVNYELGTIQNSVLARRIPPVWVGYPIRDRIRERIGIPLGIETTISSICAGEYIFGSCRGHARVAVMMCYHSIQMGCIQNGMLIRPAEDMDNPFAHMVIAMGGEECECGDYGCVGAYSSAPAIVRSFVSELKTGRDSVLREKAFADITIEDIMNAADGGDHLAAEVIVRAATVVSIAAMNYINLTDPDILVCAGILNEGCDLYFQTVRQTISRKLAYQNRQNRLTFAKRSASGRSAVGAAITAIEAAMGRLF